jgi:hypothetical protein
MSGARLAVTVSPGAAPLLAERGSTPCRSATGPHADATLSRYPDCVAGRSASVP